MKVRFILRLSTRNFHWVLYAIHHNISLKPNCWKVILHPADPPCLFSYKKELLSSNNVLFRKVLLKYLTIPDECTLCFLCIHMDNAMVFHDCLPFDTPCIYLLNKKSFSYFLINRDSTKDCWIRRILIQNDILSFFKIYFQLSKTLTLTRVQRRGCLQKPRNWGK